MKKLLLATVLIIVLGCSDDSAVLHVGIREYSIYQKGLIIDSTVAIAKKNSFGTKVEVKWFPSTKYYLNDSISELIYPSNDDIGNTNRIPNPFISVLGEAISFKLPLLEIVDIAEGEKVEYRHDGVWKGANYDYKYHVRYLGNISDIVLNNEVEASKYKYTIMDYFDMPLDLVYYYNNHYGYYKIEYTYGENDISVLLTNFYEQ